MVMVKVVVVESVDGGGDGVSIWDLLWNDLYRKLLERNLNGPEATWRIALRKLGNRTSSET